MLKFSTDVCLKEIWRVGKDARALGIDEWSSWIYVFAGPAKDGIHMLLG
jgi:hypothetical protein